MLARKVDSALGTVSSGSRLIEYKICMTLMRMFLLLSIFQRAYKPDRREIDSRSCDCELKPRKSGSILGEYNSYQSRFIRIQRKSFFLNCGVFVWLISIISTLNSNGADDTMPSAPFILACTFIANIAVESHQRWAVY